MSKGHHKRDAMAERFAAADLANPIVDLPTDVRGCARCGVAVRMSTDPPTITATSISVAGPMAMTSAGQRFHRETILPLCPACTERREVAQRWADDEWTLAQRWGSLPVVVGRVWCALDGIVLAGGKPPESVRDVLLAAKHLGDIGNGAQWSLRFSPVLAQGAKPEQGTMRPWGHVAESVRTDARAAYAAMLLARVDQPIMRACPSRGCLYCGVGSVLALRSAEPWTPHMFTLAPIGGGQGRAGQASRAGFLCPTCERAYQDEGQANGMSALTRSLLVALGHREGRDGPPIASGLEAWCVTERPPSAEPFGWLSNLDRLRAEWGPRPESASQRRSRENREAAARKRSEAARAAMAADHARRVERDRAARG
ncbi:hypothetical protein [Demequina subtropica]|uniref:hypothetical protein n=1 Tax=Demequina subtropica TaxID=1638989 RepID=UPI0007848E04|nr:hypothetical protein [Demequina subtropica]